MRVMPNCQGVGWRGTLPQPLQALRPVQQAPQRPRPPAAAFQLAQQCFAAFEQQLHCCCLLLLSSALLASTEQKKAAAPLGAFAAAVRPHLQRCKVPQSSGNGNKMVEKSTVRLGAPSASFPSLARRAKRPRSRLLASPCFPLLLLSTSCCQE